MEIQFRDFDAETLNQSTNDLNGCRQDNGSVGVDQWNHDKSV